MHVPIFVWPLPYLRNRRRGELGTPLCFCWPACSVRSLRSECSCRPELRIVATHPYGGVQSAKRYILCCTGFCSALAYVPPESWERSGGCYRPRMSQNSSGEQGYEILILRRSFEINSSVVIRPTQEHPGGVA